MTRESDVAKREDEYMDVVHAADNRWHMSLGPVEKWIVSLAGVFIMAAFAMGYNSILTRLDENATLANRLQINQAVLSNQFMTLSTQLADVPNIRKSIAENTADLQRNTQDLKDVRIDLNEQIRKR